MSGDERLELFKEKHAAYIVSFQRDKEGYEYCASEYLRLSGIYWGTTALWLLSTDQGRDYKSELPREEVVQDVLLCRNEDGGFGSAEGHDSHLLYTLSAVQILATYGALGELADADWDLTATWVARLQNADGSFCGDKWGEVDTRFSYCAASCLSLLGRSEKIDKDKAVAFLLKCRNFDEGFGARPGDETHAGQVFCCVGALAIARRLDLVDRPLLCWWLAERQCDSGGLNGRPEKQADVCYSWWILSVLRMLGADHWIDGARLRSFILKCQDLPDGGIADRPGNCPDVFHTFFGVGGLSLLGALPGDRPGIDAVFALPEDVVESLGLEAQTVPRNDASLLDAWAAERRGGGARTPIV